MFGVLVVRHARILHAIDCAEAGVRLASAGLAREARDWSRLADVPPPAWLDVEAHPYARDLDLVGHASLAKWIGRAATLDGADRLWRWLLDPADAAAVSERQPAIEELAARREWRESLAIEGQLMSVSAADIARFLEWAERPGSAVFGFMRGAVLVLPVSLAVLGVLYLSGAVQGAWWLLPLSLNVMLSYALSARAHREL